MSVTKCIVPRFNLPVLSEKYILYLQLFLDSKIAKMEVHLFMNVADHFAVVRCQLSKNFLETC